MAAAITLASTTQEQQIIELLNKSRAVIDAYIAANPEVDLKGLSVNADLDITGKVMSFTALIPVTLTEDPDGGFSVDAQELLP
ncbi:MAG: hypothetical protein WA949_07380 [Phormidesmis sp.]